MESIKLAKGKEYFVFFHLSPRSPPSFALSLQEVRNINDTFQIIISNDYLPSSLHLCVVSGKRAKLFHSRNKAASPICRKLLQTKYTMCGPTWKMDTTQACTPTELDSSNRGAFSSKSSKEHIHAFHLSPPNGQRTFCR